MSEPTPAQRAMRAITAKQVFARRRCLRAGSTTREVTCTLDASHDDAIDAAYFVKYGNGSPSQSITSPLAKQTTLRVDPR